MEGYAVDGLAAGGEPAAEGGEVLAPELARVAAAAEAAEPGSGRAAVRVVLLVRAAGRLGTLEDMEVLAVEESRRIGRDSLQLALDNQAVEEARLAGVTGSDGVRRARREDSSTSLLTVLGDVRVRRVAYRSGAKGVPALHPRDAVLNLPPGGFSWQVRKLAEMTCRSGTYDSAREIIAAVTGAVVGKRQLQEMMEDCAADAEAFAEDRPVPAAPVVAGPDGQQVPAAGVASADGKGVSMLPGALRPRAARQAARKDGTHARKLGSRQKNGNKRIAQTGVVYDCLPRACQVFGSVAVSVVAECAEVTRSVMIDAEELAGTVFSGVVFPGHRGCRGCGRHDRGPGGDPGRAGFLPGLRAGNLARARLSRADARRRSG